MTPRAEIIGLLVRTNALTTLSKYTPEDVNLVEDWWISKSRVNFLAYRQYMRHGNFFHNWFIADICRRLQNFYLALLNGERPILLIQSPPQHGKSWAIIDFIAWISGKVPHLRSIYASYSEKLGIRCNLGQQRQMDNPKYSKIFPDTNLASKKGEAVRNSTQLEFVDKEGLTTGGLFGNTTVAGSITGESLDLGVIDDAVKGREQANNIALSEKTWEWFTDDFSTRFSDAAGLIVVMTRWATHDLIGRLIDKFKENNKEFMWINYKAVATMDELNRKTGQPLFPKLKSIEFLNDKKALMAEPSWESLYQGEPTVTGGDLFKDEYWRWWKVLPSLQYKFITADTAQKTKDTNDWAVFQCWGFGIDGRIYLLDKLREKFEFPELKKEAEMFYRKHDTKRKKPTDPILRGMYIEDKSSGTGLLQEFRRKNMKVIEVPRIIDKILRAKDASVYIAAGLVVLNTKVPGVSNLTSEGRIFPNGEFDDDIDTAMTAIEVAFINDDGEVMIGVI